MNENTDNRMQTMLAVLAAVTGLILIFIVPAQIMFPINIAFAEFHQNASAFNTAHPLSLGLLQFLYPLLSALVMITGAALVLLALPIYYKNFWARPLAIGMLALPAVGGAFIIETVPLFSGELVINGIILFFISIIPYLFLLLWGQAPKTAKLLKFLVFFLIILATAANLFSASEAFLQVNAALKAGSATLHYTYLLGVYTNITGVLLVLLGVPFLAGRAQIGQWLVSLGIAAMVIGSGRLSVLGHPHMILYLPASIIALITLVLLFIWVGRERQSLHRSTTSDNSPIM